MTTIAVKDGVMAADTQETDQGLRMPCSKIYKKRIGKKNPRTVYFGTAGGSYAGMIFVDWYGSRKAFPEALKYLHEDEDFCILMVDRGVLYHVNWMCRPVEILADYYAVGSGSHLALGAMSAGASAEEAVKIAADYDPFTSEPIETIKFA